MMELELVLMVLVVLALVTDGDESTGWWVARQAKTHAGCLIFNAFTHTCYMYAKQTKM